MAIVGAAVLGWSLAASGARIDDTPKTGAPAPAVASVSTAPLTSLDAAVVIGASVSDGFGTMVTPPAGPTGTPERAVLVDIADILAAITGRAEPLPSSTTAFFFRTPDRTAELQLAFAKLKSPKVVFALDYLFWHSYGSMPDEERMVMLEKGLKRLDQLPGPMVVTDLPDMSHAVGMMLSRSQVPTKATLAKLNERIAAWAQGRKDVVVLSMTGVVADSMANRALKLGGREYPAGESRVLLTADGLHATADGEIGVSLEAIDRLMAAGVLDKAMVVERDPAVIRSRLLKMKAPPPAPPAPPLPPLPAVPAAPIPTPTTDPASAPK